MLRRLNFVSIKKNRYSQEELDSLNVDIIKNNNYLKYLQIHSGGDKEIIKSISGDFEKIILTDGKKEEICYIRKTNELLDQRFEKSEEGDIVTYKGIQFLKENENWNEITKGMSGGDAFEGEIRTWNGKQYQKRGDKWIPYNSKRQESKKEEPKKEDSKQEEPSQEGPYKSNPNKKIDKKEIKTWNNEKLLATFDEENENNLSEVDAEIVGNELEKRGMINEDGELLDKKYWKQDPTLKNQKTKPYDVNKVKNFIEKEGKKSLNKLGPNAEKVFDKNGFEGLMNYLNGGK